MKHCGLFVTGTDTDVGKTAVAVAIVRQLVGAGIRVGVYKPVASGVVAGAVNDVDQLWEAADRPLSRERVCPQVFAAPIAPPRAARVAGSIVDERLLCDGFSPWRAASDVVVVEGAGGLFSPLGDTLLNVDLVADLGLPLVIVDAARLGAIGRTLATVQAARARGLSIAAVVLSHTQPLVGSLADPVSDAGIAHDSAGDLAARLAPLPVAVLAHGAALIEPQIDWLAIMEDRL
ncbi:MAG: dethiobiotin synthase [Planctomycetia bacterium]|jgi:dethiobiotin synthetase|nr:dethiobiotin synthase [Planctomycetia bacterium]